MLLRTATPEDAGWVDEQYERAGFIPSDLSIDTVVIAEWEGVRAGLGRLVRVDTHAFELGGMFIVEDHRGRGIARALVEELLRRAGDAEVYCVPYADLESFYARCGFRPLREAVVPRKVHEKLDWCAREQSRAVLLMKLDHQR